MEGDNGTNLLCRVCINEIDLTEKWYSLFMKYEDLSTPEQEQVNVSVADKITALTDVSITKADELPSQICSTCHLELQEAYNFKLKCEYSDKLLRINHNSKKKNDREIEFILKLEAVHDSEQTFSDDELNTSFLTAENEDNSNADIKLTNEKDYFGIEKEEEIEYSEPSDVKLEKEEETDKELQKLKLSPGKIKTKHISLKCNICDNLFKTECKLRVHRKKEHKIFECCSCKTQFKSVYELRGHKFGNICSKHISTTLTNSPTETAKVNMLSNKTENNKKISNVTVLKPQCHDCGSVFKSKCKLRVHWHKVHYAFRCPICGQLFKTSHALQTHTKQKTKMCINAAIINIQIINGAINYNCKLCDYKSKSRCGMRQHLNVHSGIGNSCNLCSKVYRTATMLRQHKADVHMLGSLKRECLKCGETIIGYRKYEYHMAKHKQKQQYQCDICKKILSRRTCLQLHILKHTGDKKYKCDLCDRLFYTRFQLKQHKFLHGSKQFCCTICGYELRTKIALASHEKKHSSNCVACNICGRFFENGTQLSFHKTRHLDKRNSCTECDMKFYDRSSLCKHLRSVHKLYVSQSLKSK